MGADQGCDTDGLPLRMQLVERHQPEAPLLRIQGIRIGGVTRGLRRIEQAKELGLQGTTPQPEDSRPLLIGLGRADSQAKAEPGHFTDGPAGGSWRGFGGKPQRRDHLPEGATMQKTILQEIRMEPAQKGRAGHRSSSHTNSTTNKAITALAPAKSTTITRRVVTGHQSKPIQMGSNGHNGGINSEATASNSRVRRR